jgi:hypothetical protein
MFCVLMAQAEGGGLAAIAASYSLRQFRVIVYPAGQQGQSVV